MKPSERIAQLTRKLNLDLGSAQYEATDPRAIVAYLDELHAVQADAKAEPGISHSPATVAMFLGRDGATGGDE